MRGTGGCVWCTSKAGAGAIRGASAARGRATGGGGRAACGPKIVAAACAAGAPIAKKATYTSIATVVRSPSTADDTGS